MLYLAVEDLDSVSQSHIKGSGVSCTVRKEFYVPRGQHVTFQQLPFV